MVVSDVSSGKIVSTIDIGERVDGCAFDPELKRAYSSNGDGTLTVVQEENENSFKVLETIQTQRGARTICINPKTQYVYLSAGEYDEPPAATAENPHPRAKPKAGSFVVLNVEMIK